MAPEPGDLEARAATLGTSRGLIMAVDPLTTLGEG